MTNAKRKVAIIDADTILYAIALSAETRAVSVDPNEEDMWLQTKSLKECYVEAVLEFAKVRDIAKADEVILCLTTSKCFRYGLLPTYKANRVQRRPAILKDLQAAIMERKPYTTMGVRGLEADDVCGIAMGTLTMAGRDCVIVSIDKDLKSIPGAFLHMPPPNAKNSRDPILYETTENQADRFFLYQTMIGDPVDGYSGIPGFGPKRAEKLLTESAHLTFAEQWRWVEDAFRAKGCDKAFALTQARVARILRNTDWDAVKREVILWTPPTSLYSKEMENRRHAVH